MAANINRPGRTRKIAAVVLLVLAPFVAAGGWAHQKAQDATITYGSYRVAQADMEYKGTTEGSFLALSVSRREAESWADTYNIVVRGNLDGQARPGRLTDNVREYDEQAGDLGAESIFDATTDNAWVSANLMVGNRIDTAYMFVISYAPEGHLLQRDDRVLALDGRSLWSEAFQQNLADAETVTVARGADVFDVPASEFDLEGVKYTNAVRLVEPRPSLIVGNHYRGPSSGIMNALTYLDGITEGDLTGGLTVAGTGSIMPTTGVGRVSGIKYKTEAAIAAGADVLFVPAENYDEAVSVADGQVEVVSVPSLTIAVRWLCKNGSTADLCDIYG